MFYAGALTGLDGPCSTPKATIDTPFFELAGG